MNIVAVDWSGNGAKRSAYRAELATRKISRLTFDIRLSHLVEFASSLQPPVLIGIDAALATANVDDFPMTELTVDHWPIDT